MWGKRIKFTEFVVPIMAIIYIVIVLVIIVISINSWSYRFSF
jgi:Na+/alanine symporter